jgi:transposase
MSQVIMVGCDLHDRSMLLRTAAGSGEPEERSFANDGPGRGGMLEYLFAFARRHGARRIVFAYEASGQGYGLYDLLTEQGLECHVLSPSHLPKTAKRKKQKTDSKDAQMPLEQVRAHVLAGNALPTVWTPPQALRNDRELVRARLETAEAQTRIKLQVFGFLKRFSVELPEWFRTNRSWTKRFVQWLRTQAQRLAPVVIPVLEGQLVRFETFQRQLVDLDRHLRQLSRTPLYRQVCEALRKRPGVGLLTAMTFLTEMGDVTRFDNRRQVAAYLGLCPSSSESGDANDRKGHITRQGPGRVRKVLCQAAWAAVRTDTVTRATWERIKRGSPKRGKKAIVAVMRQMAIRLWHVALACGTPADWITPPPRPPRWLETPPNVVGTNAA